MGEPGAAEDDSPPHDMEGAQGAGRRRDLTLVAIARLRAIGEEARQSGRKPADVPRGWGHLRAGDIRRLCDVAEAAMKVAGPAVNRVAPDDWDELHRALGALLED